MKETILFINPSNQSLFLLYQESLFLSAFFSFENEGLRIYDVKLSEDSKDQIEELTWLFDSHELFDCYLYEDEIERNQVRNQSTLQEILSLYFKSCERLHKLGLANLQDFFEQEISELLSEKAFTYQGKAGKANEWICNKEIAFDRHEILQPIASNQSIENLLKTNQ